MREKKEKYAVITPKHEGAKKQMEYHGERWVFRGEVESLKFVRGEGPFIVLVSRDGKKCLHIKKRDDKDFAVRLLD